MPEDRQEPPNILGDHVRRGRRYRSRVAALDGFTPNDWVRDDAPDLLWPVMLVGLQGEEGAAAFARFQDAVAEGVGLGETPGGAVRLDGRMTSLEAVSDEHRAKVIDAIEQLDRPSIMPDLVVAAASLYDNVPGAWLLLDPWDTPAVPPDTALRAMADALIAVVSDRHLNALVKAAPFGWELRSGRVHLPGEVAADLVDYPVVAENRGKADAVILSSFLAHKAMEEEAQPDLRSARLDWAKRFWSTNWMVSECILEGDLDGDDTYDSGDHPVEAETEGGAQDKESSSSARLEQRMKAAFGEVDRQVSRLEDAVFDREQAVDLHNPARHEVLAGFGMRACRAAAALLLAPHMWTGEHASGVMRYLAEATIVLKWMKAQASDDIYQDFQDYGRGKRKLQLRHLKATVQSNPDGPDEFVGSMLAEMVKRAGGEWSEEIQEVNVEATFSGISLRQMAHEVGERNLYNHVFQPTSGLSHGEWWALEDYALQRCFNPLHRFHLMPQFRWGLPAPHPQFVEVLLDSLERVLSAVVEGLAEEPHDD